MNVYAKAGESLQQIGGDCPPGCACMNGERPGRDYIANEAGEWIPAPTAVPDRVTVFQGLAALAAAGQLEAVEAHFREPKTPLLQRLAYERAASWERDSAVIAYMADRMDWDAAYVDRLFIEAKKLEGKW